jgi:hypothetical protein
MDELPGKTPTVTSRMKNIDNNWIGWSHHRGTSRMDPKCFQCVAQARHGDVGCTLMQRD